MTRADMDEVRDEFVAATPRAGGGRVRPARAAHGPRLPAVLVPVAADQPPRGRVRRRSSRAPASRSRCSRRAARCGRPSGRCRCGSRPPTGSRAASTATTRWRSRACCARRAATSSTSRPARSGPTSSRPTGAASRRRSPTGSATRSGIPTIAVGAISSYDDVNTIVLAGRADLCALARPHLYDPHWTLHAAADQGCDVEWVPQYRSGSRRAEHRQGRRDPQGAGAPLRRRRRRRAPARPLAAEGDA